jgi:hypothetical protein
MASFYKGPRGCLNMISTLISLFQTHKPWQVEIQNLHESLVPISGEAESLQGELVRCVQSLADEANRNGWMNWDRGDEESLEVLERFLPDPKVFDQSLCELIRAKLGQIRYAGEKGADDGDMGYAEISFIAEHVVLWCRKNRKSVLKPIDSTWLD